MQIITCKWDMPRLIPDMQRFKRRKYRWAPHFHRFHIHCFSYPRIRACLTLLYFYVGVLKKSFCWGGGREKP